MTRVFLSHSSRDSRQAIAVQRWLVEQEPGLADEIFLDLDPHTGIRPGERWKQALQQANTRCEAVICLLSEHWAASHECTTEYRYAETLNKAIVVARLEPVPGRDITSEWQRCDLFGDGPTTEISVDGGGPVVLASEGLHRLLDGLRALGIEAEQFPWPPPQDPDRAPYRGWAPLEEADAAVFFGRDAQIVRGMDDLRGMRSSGVKSLLVILGPSGTGKSSFLRAGLLPRLRRDDRQFVPLPIVRPEQAVLTGEFGLAAAIYHLRTGLGLATPLLGEIKTACLAGDVERLRGWLVEGRQAAHARLLDVPAEQPAPTLVLPLDQGEELFNADAGPQALQFLEILAGLLRRDTAVTPGLVVAVTIRADRYEPLQTAPELAGVQSAVFDELKPMPAAGLKDVITGPARRATAAGRRLRIDPALVDRLLADAAEGADTLPLLALTLERLYHDFGAGGKLSVADYESMGGMAQVVQTEVDNLLAADPATRQAHLELLHDAFIPWMATINPGSDQPTRRLARYHDLPAASHPLIEAFVEKRLLVKDTRGGQIVVEVALESLLRQWRELAGWLRAESQDLKDADTLERDAADWQASGRDQAWLLEGTRLAEAETLAAKSGFRDRLNPTRDFLHASRTREAERIAAENEAREAQAHAVALRRRSRVIGGILAATAIVAILAVVGGVVSIQARNEADLRNREITASRLVSDARTLLVGAEPENEARALKQALAARAVQPASENDSTLQSALSTRRAVLKIVETPAAVSAIALATNDQRIVSGLLDDTVRLWDAATGQPLGQPMTGHQGAVTSVAFSPDGHRIISGSADTTVRLWDADASQPLGRTMTGHQGAVTSVAFSPDGQRIVSGSFDGTVRIWDAAIGQPIGEPMTGHQGPVRGVAFSPDGHRIISGGADTTVRLWDADTGQPIGQPLGGHTDSVSSVAFSPDGQRIISGSADTTVRVWDAATGRSIGEPLSGHDDDVRTVAFSHSGGRIVSASADTTIRIWDPSTGLATMGHQSAVTSMAFSPDGTRIISGSADNTVRLWDAATGQSLGPPLTGHQGAVTSVAFSPDGTRIISGSADNTVRLWDAETGQSLGPPLTGHTDSVSSVAFSPDGTRIASGSADNTVRLWDAATGQSLGPPLTGHTDSVSSVAFSPDGTRIASGSADTTVRLWDAATGQSLGPPLTGHTDSVSSVAFSPDGTRIISGSADTTVRLWDAGTGQSRPPLTGHTDSVSSVAFSPDGTRIISGSADNTVRLWDAETGQSLGPPLTGHQGAVTSVAFSPDGTRIASGSADTTVRQSSAVGTRPAGLADDLCSKLTQNMSRQEWGEWVSPHIGYIPVCPGLPIPPDDGSR